MIQLLAKSNFMCLAVHLLLLSCVCTHVHAQGCTLEELFGRDVKYSVGDEPISIRIADFDDDGIRDLVVINRGSDNLSILLGIGNGVFATQTQYPVGSGPREVEVGDIDLDGDLDLVVSMNSETAFHIMLNDGSGGFDAVLPIDLGVTQSEIELADFDDNGMLDVVVGTSTGVRIRLNDTTSPFESGLDLLTEYNVLEVLAGDIDQDGNIDVLTRTGFSGDGCDYRVLLGLGDVGFSELACEQVSNGFSSQTLLFDLDDDADLDLVFTSDVGDEVCTMKHSAQGNFVNEYHIPRFVSNPNGITWGDFNLDGLPDLAMSRDIGFDGVVFLGSGSGFFNLTQRFDVGRDTLCVEAGDLDRDGDIDLVVGNDFDDTISVVMNRCDTVVCFADLSPDGQLDFFDVSVFIVLYLSVDPSADFNHDGQLNFFDVAAFIAAFNAGCL